MLRCKIHDISTRLSCTSWDDFTILPIRAGVWTSVAIWSGSRISPKTWSWTSVMRASISSTWSWHDEAIQIPAEYSLPLQKFLPIFLHSPYSGVLIKSNTSTLKVLRAEKRSLHQPISSVHVPSRQHLDATVRLTVLQTGEAPLMGPTKVRST